MILCGMEIPSQKAISSRLMEANNLNVIQYRDKIYIGEIISNKNCFTGADVIEMLTKCGHYEWHPRFVRHIEEAIRRYDETFNLKLDFHNFESTSVKILS